MTKHEIKIGILGGSGLYNIEGFTKLEDIKATTPWGSPSSDIEIYENEDKIKLAFLSRHGKNHHLNPSEVPYKQNIAALKSLGIEYILSFTAVGSLNENMKPGEFVLADQILDRTKGIRSSTFFENGIVGHVPMAQPFDNELRRSISSFQNKFNDLGVVLHNEGNLVVIEGPQFSTKFESKLYKSWGCDIINMSGIPEAKLAKEAEMAYQTIAMVTDFDCWIESEEVSVEKVLKIMKENNVKFNTILKEIIPPLDKVIKERKLVNELKGEVFKSLVFAGIPKDAQERLDFLYNL